MVVAYATMIDEVVVSTACNSTAVEGADPVVCRCLNITESTLKEVTAQCPLMSLCEIARLTGAGTGCTACHRRLRKFFAADRL
jgi:bacterioferritin-associated ferredoxin